MTAYSAAEAALRRTIADAEAKLALMSVLPPVDNYPDGTVVRIVVRPRTGDRSPLTYVALKIIQHVPTVGHVRDDAKWYFTGFLAGGRDGDNRARWVRWDELIRWCVHVVEIEAWDVMYPADFVEAVVRGSLTAAEEAGDLMSRAGVDVASRIGDHIVSSLTHVRRQVDGS